MGFFENKRIEQENAWNEARYFLLTNLDLLPNHYLIKSDSKKIQALKNTAAFKAEIESGHLIENFLVAYLNIPYDELIRAHQEKFHRKTKLEIELPNVFMEVIPAVIEGKDHRIATMLSQGIEITYVMQRLYAQRAIAENVSDGIGNPYLDSDETRMNSLVEKYGLQYILDYLFNVYSSSNSKSFKKYTNEFLTLIYVNLVFLNFQRR
jgi:hypothetical protein